jgi:hypothetical protein
MNKNIKFHVSKFLPYLSIHNDGCFMMTAAKLINNSEAADRCDFNNWGPIAPQNNETHLNKSMGTVFFSSVEEIDKFEILYSLPPHGYIIYLKLKDDKVNQQIKSQELPIGANSFGELIRLMIEWSVVAKEPFNNMDKCSEISIALLEDMNMPEQLIQHILDTYPPMQVSKYLMGQENAQLQNENIFLIDESLQEWFMSEAIPDDFIELNGERIPINDSRIFYSSLKDKNMPTDNAIDK